MAQYAILRFAKHKGGAGRALEAHHERQKEKYASNPDIDTAKSKYNFHIVHPQNSYRNEMDSRITAAGCRTRKDSTRFVDTLITASPEFFKGKKREETRAFFERAVAFLDKKIGRKNIFSAVVHMDEKTPHLHLCFTPITKDIRLSAKDILGNRASLIKWQDEFWAHMVKGYPELERGESASKTGRKHIPTRIFKQAVNLTKQAEKIQETLDSINPLNAGKKREEVITLLNKFFPGMESFEAQIRKYRREFERQEKVNASLKTEIEASKVGIMERLEAQQVKKDFERLKIVYEAIPEDIRREALASLRAQQQRQPRERGLDDR